MCPAVVSKQGASLRTSWTYLVQPPWGFNLFCLSVAAYSLDICCTCYQLSFSTFLPIWWPHLNPSTAPPSVNLSSVLWCGEVKTSGWVCKAPKTPTVLLLPSEWWWEHWSILESVTPEKHWLFAFTLKFLLSMTVWFSFTGGRDIRWHPEILRKEQFPPSQADCFYVRCTGLETFTNAAFS